MYRDLKAPFPYFGGKRTVAAEVWKRFGSVRTYIEPFFGSGAVLLRRPWGGDFGNEVINDNDALVANVWRAIKFAPDEVATWCDWPCNHADLMARRKVLVGEYEALKEQLIDDPEFYNSKLAGYWVWCASVWIGNGLKMPGAIPCLSCNRGITQVTGEAVYKWMQRLSERLRRVKVVCGDWTRVMGGNWCFNKGICAVFLDPPYTAGREKNLYAHDCTEISGAVLDWCRENGDNPLYRIAFCGYDKGEGAELLEKQGWSTFHWKAQGGYAFTGKDDNSRGRKNRLKETIWFSPYCLKDLLLFD